MQTHAATKPSASHASKPFLGSVAARATTFFSSSPAIQTKLTEGESGDRFEREADTVADAVVQRTASPASGGSTMPSVQAKCAKCEHEEMVRRQAETGLTPEADAHIRDLVQQGLAAQRGGQALAPPLRQEMEQGIGADFTGVRIHTGAPAARLNEQLHARAFTHGQDVFFNSGQFDPGSSSGRHLLAHELTHVVQQSASQTPNIQRDDAGGGSTEFTDTVSSTVRSSGTPVISGTVTRTEMAPASGSLPREEIHRGTMNLAFDPRTCVVTIPFGYRFVQAAPADRGVCDAGPNHTLLSPTEFATLKSNVLRVVNAGLNGWFDVQLSGSGCPNGCTDRRLPIRVVATENDTNPDTTITVVNRVGRANAGTICVRSWNDSTAVHEGGHQVLGVGDEYPERDESLRASVPQWFRAERVRRDYSRMGPDEHSRFAMFQARHFAAVAAFLQHIYPQCTATLVPRARPIIPDFRFGLTTGYTAVSGLPGFFLRAGFDLGIPLDRMRRWELTLGPEFTMMFGSGDLRHQSAFLLGARLGLEGSTGDAGFGVTGGPFLSAGYGWFDSHDYGAGAGPGVGNRSAGSAYGELGGRFGIRTGLSDGMRFNLGLEGAVGSALGAPGGIGPVGRDILSDPARTYWFRVGLGAVLQF